MKKILTFSLLLILSCTTGPKSAPYWVNEQPISQNSWIGIGYATVSGDEYRETARNKAIQEIASQIEVHIESSLKTVTTEVNFKVDEFAESIIQSRVNMTLEDVRIKDTHSSDDDYYVLMELRYSDYYRRIELKKQKAINTAIDYMTTAENNLSIESFRYLSRSLEEINPFMDLPLKAEYPKGSGQKINLFSTINILTGDLINRIVLTCDKSEISTIIGMRNEHVFKVRCVDKQTGKPLSNIPLNSSMNGNNITENVITSETGEAVFHLFKVTDKRPVQYFDITVDLSENEGNIDITNLATVNVKVNAKSPTIFINITEKNLNESVANPFVMPAIKEFFVETYGAEFTDSKKQSDFYISAEVNTTAKSMTKNEYGLFQAYGDGTISIFDTSTEKELYQKSKNNVMGADFTSIEGAGRNALKKMVKILKTETFSEIIAGLDDYSEKKKR
jgi:hypothetical protein|tara:strand:+ start:742 stop:2085 length:1344 start_codon:yes stop_codon:yes gene_type:complete